MTDFLFSAESRWFSEGTIPQSLYDWFHQSPFCSQPSQRTDQYLIFPHADKLGVKIREGRFELKVRVKEVQDWTMGQTHGVIEYWEKWSSREIAGISSFNPLQPTEHSINVKKSRTLRLFSLESKEIAESDIRTGYVPLTRGCQMELTEIRIQNRIFWSLGFEAFSEFQDHLQVLTDTMRAVFIKGDCPLKLPRNFACSYPVLLHRYRYGY